MIKGTRINDHEIVINSELIEYIEANPDTTITMTTGKKIIVRESVDDIIRKSVEYKKGFFSNTNE